MLWTGAGAGAGGTRGAVVGHFSVFSQVSDATAVVPAVPASCLGWSDGRSVGRSAPMRFPVCVGSGGVFLQIEKEEGEKERGGRGRTPQVCPLAFLSQT